jgi:hypothetical protein
MATRLAYPRMNPQIMARALIIQESENIGDLLQYLSTLDEKPSV